MIRERESLRGPDGQMEEVFQQTGMSDAASLPPERRQHRRLQMHLPLEFCRASESAAGRHHTVTRDVSTGGIYFETAMDDLRKGELLDIEMTIPPGEGHFPYQGRVSSVARVIRMEVPSGLVGRVANRRMGVGVAFRESFKLSF